MSATVLAIIAAALVGAAGFLWFRSMYRVRIPEDRTPFLAAWLGGALLAVTALVQGAGWLGTPFAVFATLGGAFFTFTVAISRQEVGPDAIRVGDMLPDFKAPDEHGGTFERASLEGRPTLIKFFRGHW